MPWRQLVRGFAGLADGCREECGNYAVLYVGDNRAINWKLACVVCRNKKATRMTAMEEKKAEQSWGRYNVVAIGLPSLAWSVFVRGSLKLKGA